MTTIAWLLIGVCTGSITCNEAIYVRPEPSKMVCTSDEKADVSRSMSYVCLTTKQVYQDLLKLSEQS